MKILYLGLDPSRFKIEGAITHYPIIQTVAFSFDNPVIQNIFKNWFQFTHIIFTSRTTVKIFLDYSSRAEVSMKDKIIIAIGKSTASLLEKVDEIALEETAEGVISCLEVMKKLEKGHLFFPHSALARSVITDYLEKRKISFTATPFYTTITRRNEPLPILEAYDAIVFTSPSTVYAFLEIFGALPRHKKLIALGPITQKVVTKCLDFSYV